MKNYYTLSRVAHAFAHNESQSGEGGNIYFHGDTIYSYGRHFPVARKIGNGKVLFTLQDYSSSTSNHKSIISSAISHYEFIYTYDVENPAKSRQVVEDAIIYNLKKLAKARKPQIYISAIKDEIKTIKKLQEIFNFKVYKKDYPNLYDAMKQGESFFSPELLEKVKKGLKAEQRKKQLKAKAQEKENREKIQRWKAFEDVSVWSALKGNDVAMRYNKQTEEVETTKSIKIPKDEALRVFNIWDKKPELLKGQRVLDGRYIVKNCTTSILLIGCHSFKKEEAKEIIQQF